MSIGGGIQVKTNSMQAVMQTLINGGDESSWSTIADLSSAVNDGPNPLDFLIIRASTGYGDDQAYTKTAKLAKDVVVKDKDGTPRGALLWGSYGFLAYGPGSKPGASQAANMWALINAGGSHYWQVPPSVDLEREPYIDNGVTQYVPLPPLEQYLDDKVMPWIEYMEKQIGRLPIVYSNLDIIIHYLKPAYGRADHKYDKLFQCPLWLALYNATPPAPNKVAPMWNPWAFWQKRGDVNDNPGISDIDYNEWPGTRAELKAWIADPTFPIPAYSTDAPPPPPPPTTVTMATVTVGSLRLRDGEGTDKNQVGYMLNGKTVQADEVIQDGDNSWVKFTGYFAAKFNGSTYATLKDVPK